MGTIPVLTGVEKIEWDMSFDGDTAMEVMGAEENWYVRIFVRVCMRVWVGGWVCACVRVSVCVCVCVMCAKEN